MPITPKRPPLSGAGAADGIGFAAARLLAGTGHPVALAAIPIFMFDRAAELSSSGFEDAYVGNLTIAADMAWLCAKVGAVEALVDNAGIGTQSRPALEKHLVDIGEAEWDHEVAVSPKTAFMVTRPFLPAMLAAGYGRMVNVASVTGPYGSMPGASPYSAAKAGMIGLTHSPALEVAACGVIVNAAGPGWIETGASTSAERDAARKTPPGRAGRADEVAAAIVFLASSAASCVNGAVIVVDGSSMDRGNMPLVAKRSPPPGLRAPGAAATRALTKPADLYNTSAHGRPVGVRWIQWSRTGWWWGSCCMATLLRPARFTA